MFLNPPAIGRFHDQKNRQGTKECDVKDLRLREWHMLAVQQRNRGGITPKKITHSAFQERVDQTADVLGIS